MEKWRIKKEIRGHACLLREVPEAATWCLNFYPTSKKLAFWSHIAKESGKLSLLWPAILSAKNLIKKKKVRRDIGEQWVVFATAVNKNPVLTYLIVQWRFTQYSFHCSTKQYLHRELKINTSSFILSLWLFVNNASPCFHINYCSLSHQILPWVNFIWNLWASYCRLRTQNK